MGRPEPLSHRAPLQEYRRQAQVLFEALQRGDDDARAQFKWELPQFRGRPLGDVDAAALTLADAETVVAAAHGFEDWDDLVAFTDDVNAGGAVDRFEAAVESVVAGDVAALRRMLRENPGLVRARSTRRHHATLLHYLGANGVEGGRQKAPPNAVEVAKVLLDAGAEADALADMYGVPCTTMSLVVSSCHPAEAGLQVALAEALLDYGAAFDAPGARGQSCLMTALTFGYLETARALARRGAPVDGIAAAAGLGESEKTAQFLPAADSESRHLALALAAQLGHADIVRLLLDAGEDASRYNPDGCHAHATPLHQAVWGGHADVVRLLVERGARLDVRDRIYEATPLDWAEYGRKTEIASYLREQSAAG